MGITTTWSAWENADENNKLLGEKPDKIKNELIAGLEWPDMNLLEKATGLVYANSELRYQLPKEIDYDMLSKWDSENIANKPVLYLNPETKKVNFDDFVPIFVDSAGYVWKPYIEVFKGVMRSMWHAAGFYMPDFEYIAYLKSRQDKIGDYHDDHRYLFPWCICSQGKDRIWVYEMTNLISQIGNQKSWKGFDWQGMALNEWGTFKENDRIVVLYSTKLNRAQDGSLS